jgi:hypothetical protein
VDYAAYQQNLTPRQKVARLSLFYNQKYHKNKVERKDIPKDVKQFIKGLPDSPFITGRAMFISSKLSGKKDAIGLMPDVQAEWTRLSAQEKKTYDDRAIADMKAYVQNLNKYIMA